MPEKKEASWLITGVSSGLGYELAKDLLSHGLSVIGTIKREGEAQDLVDRYPETFARYVLDFADSSSVEKASEAIWSRFSSAKVIVLNAGYILYGAAEELSSYEAHHVIEANLIGPTLFLKRALPGLRNRKSGMIIYVSDAKARLPEAGSALYQAAKRGMEAYMESLGLELEPFGIKTVIVEPGPFRSPFGGENAKIATLREEYDQTPAHAFLSGFGPEATLEEGDPKKMAKKIEEIPERPKAPYLIVFGEPSRQKIIKKAEADLREYKKGEALAAETDFKQRKPRAKKRGRKRKGS